MRVGRVLGSCTGADHESLIVWRGYQQKLPELNLVEVRTKFRVLWYGSAESQLKKKFVVYYFNIYLE